MFQSNLILLLSFSTGRHMSVTSPAILANFFEKQCTQNHPQYLSGLSRALYPTSFLEIAVYTDAKRRGIYLALFTDPEGDSCFSIYQISWIKMKKSNLSTLKTSLSRNFVYNLQTFRGFQQVHFYVVFFCKFSMKIIFYLPVNNDKPKFVAFFVFVRMLYLSLKFRLLKMSRKETPSWLSGHKQ